MNFSIKNIPGISNFFNVNSSSETFVKKTKNGMSFSLKGNRSYRFDLDIKLLDDAILQAEDIDFPSRLMLYNIYDHLKDLHVKSQIRTAIFKVISQPWVIVDKNNKPNKDLTELFKKQWFNTLNEHFISTEFWGHSLIYFVMNENGEIKESKLFPRMHVNPEKESIIPDLDDAEKTLSYIDTPILKGLFLEVKNTDTLGLLKDITRCSILKGCAISDWARSSEKWGDPHVILKSSSQSDPEDDKKEEFLKNFGNNGYAIVDKEDEIELLERGSAGSSHNIFLDLIKLNNDENSKGINGQTATTDQQSFVGSAEVQERILNDYTLVRLKDLMFFHNETTLPFLINYNNGNTVYKKLDGYKWMPLAFIDNEEEKPNPTPTPNPKKKKDELKENELNNLHDPFI